MKRLIAKFIGSLWQIPTWVFCRLLPLKKNKVVISSFFGRGYGDNPKYIAECLLEGQDRLQIIWLVQDQKEADTLPEGITPCMMRGVAPIYHLSTAKVWIDNCRKRFFLFKRKKQFYLQTWHGFALKKIERDAERSLSEWYLKTAKRDSRAIDCIVSCSRFMSGIYHGSFWYEGEVLEWGAPRNDMLLAGNVQTKKKVCEALGIPTEKKLLMYAPTFRADGDMSVYDLDYVRIREACETRFGGEFVILTRLHPNIASKSESIPFDGIGLINASYYPDMQELMAACDVAITDYSSIMFDFSISLKPCFQFAVDIQEYKKDRDFYFPIDDLPFPLSESNDALIGQIRDFDMEGYTASLQAFYDAVGMVTEGKAAQRCADMIRTICRKS